MGWRTDIMSLGYGIGYDERLYLEFPIENRQV